MPMDENLRAQLHTYLAHLDGLIRRGHQVLRTLASDPSNPATMAATRTWQEECGVTINQLSGGSKAHWLARAFSEAFLIRSASGNAVTAVSPAELVKRTIGVLEQAVASLAGMNEGRDDSGSSASSSSGSSAAPPPRRFEFVHSLELRPIVEQAYIDSRRAIEQGNYDLALRTSCGILETIVTDALEFKGLPALATSGAPVGKIADWAFETRLAVAESAGLIRGGCARLPAVARAYRDHDIANVDSARRATVSERDARQTGQVLHVVMRDLDPGR
ncbi:MAG TPA: hypothetical protein VN902_22850 [Candidatus Acidoferrales bacterium]|jgi:hypothetical protein|nr:hypothetical protein [Candidatus Acidoferrales bacterium]